MSNGDRRRVHQIRCQRDERSLTDYISDTQERDSIHVVILSAGTAKEAVMDDHTFSFWDRLTSSYVERRC